MAWRSRPFYLVAVSTFCIAIGLRTNALQFENSLRTLVQCRRSETSDNAARRRVQLSAVPEETNRNNFSTSWPKITQNQAFFSLPLSSDRAKDVVHRTNKYSSVIESIKSKFLFWKDRNNGQGCDSANSVVFSYDYDVMEIGPDIPSKFKSVNTTGIILIHPIGVGIAKWFYQRLMASLPTSYGEFYNQTLPQNRNFVVVVPDLLGSGSACNPTLCYSHGELYQLDISKFPLFNISDWGSQIETLMGAVEKTHVIDQWCVVANGGCSPIALQVAAKSANGECTTHAAVSNVILSSVPRLPFFLNASNTPSKVKKSYRTLSGLPGRLFWWYALRNQGTFIQKFSEQNLVADPSNLGENWRVNCYNTAKMHDGKSKYSTFAFLAGALQDGCVQSLESLRGTRVSIDVIKGGDLRQNRARSWFWQKKRQQETKDTGAPVEQYETLRDYVERNGNSGREIVIGGRISLAHEDPIGYSKAIWGFLQ
jgi:hypothetical protein